MAENNSLNYKYEEGLGVDEESVAQGIEQLADLIIALYLNQRNSHQDEDSDLL